MWMFVFWILPLLGILYIAWHVWTILPLAAGWKLLVIALGVMCFVLLFLNFGRRFEHLPLSVSQCLYEIGTSSIFVMLYLVIVFLVLDLGRLVHLVPKAFLYHNGYTALGYHNPRKELSRWVDMINAEKPDFILIAGDIIDGSMRPLLEERMAEEFHRLTAPVYACLGNHEFYAGHPAAKQFLKDAGIRLLIDEAAVIDSSIVVIGRDDRTNMRRKPVKDLVSTLPSSLYTVILDHQPYNLDRAEAAGVDFQLSGHTHCGQVWPISWITDAIYECAWGSHQRGNTQYYVSSGIGIWGGKFRIGTQSEYVVATISSKQ